MKKNMGAVDRVLRTIIALVIAYLWWTGTISGGLGVALAILAAIFLLTSAISFCPLYRPLGLSTCGRAK
ncbi:DUF2892 domain-containing protein [Sphingobium yanoikuyae]|jgi:hypothetical protein|uniref:Inner membrane protein YgaP-like transmembrane domain-containing protein n=2 Tax=Sphingobium yanoikuyae TaxID=13690 RepID=K9CXA8_SPHYA|nr:MULTISPECIES: DUF2892 domain-containing protein [Sphingomonadaceae]APX65960.1 hypothetical protein AV944_09060 [Sphingomonas sp. LK11]EKU75586.1 hypothetical protein HMPREF9718_03114 [Sphingobium yanoikuyae ATCC 51230]MDH2135390.1 DUF2892 domain-containing protein [Sphingobium yanoikuyae]MDH2153573.1 DUF2892 domain-containing protein [Sphingobium yanoikuyae]MDH2170738.1 DUF2892 domain-containing protein [Sphingobium yanoikuyae]